MLAVDQERPHSNGGRAIDVVLDGVADHDGLVCPHPEQLEGGAKDRLVRLDPPVRPRGDCAVDLEQVMRDEVRDLAAAVGNEAQLQPVATQLLEHRQGVVVEVEVLGELPELRHLDCQVPRRRGVAAHAPDDQLGEGEPHLLVMPELGVALDLCDRPGACLEVGVRVELEPVLAAQVDVPLGAEVGPRLGEGEVDVEEHGPQLHARKFALACSCWVVRYVG